MMIGDGLIIDNFSRKVLAWHVAERLEMASTVAILRERVSVPDVLPRDLLRN